MSNKINLIVDDTKCLNTPIDTIQNIQNGNCVDFINDFSNEAQNNMQEDQQNTEYFTEENTQGSTIDELFAKKLEYNLNKTVKELKMIADYYELKTRKLKKDELINLIVEFEEDDKNQEIVSQRRHSWYCLEQICDDSFLQKYINL